MQNSYLKEYGHLICTVEFECKLMGLDFVENDSCMNVNAATAISEHKYMTVHLALERASCVLCKHRRGLGTKPCCIFCDVDEQGDSDIAFADTFPNSLPI